MYISWNGWVCRQMDLDLGPFTFDRPSNIVIIITNIIFFLFQFLCLFIILFVCLN